MASRHHVFLHAHFFSNTNFENLFICQCYFFFGKKALLSAIHIGHVTTDQIDNESIFYLQL